MTITYTSSSFLALHVVCEELSYLRSSGWQHPTSKFLAVWKLCCQVPPPPPPPLPSPSLLLSPPLPLPSQYDVRVDEEQNVKLTETINLLLAAGYFRARIKGLSPFDKVGRVKQGEMEHKPCTSCDTLGFKFLYITRGSSTLSTYWENNLVCSLLRATGSISCT